MKNFIPLALFCLIGGAASAQSVPEGYEIGRWKNFSASAVSHTFDDNIGLQLSVVVPIFNEFDFNLTLYTMTDAWEPANWAALKAAAAEGHEIGSHSVTHANFNDIPEASEAVELNDSQESIWNETSTDQALTFAYPYCVTGNDSLVASRYIAARVCSGSIVPATPPNFYAISSIIVGSEGSVQRSADLNNKVRSGKTARGWTVFLYHAIDNSGGYSPIPSQQIRGHLEFLRDNPADYWVESFVNVVKYIKERNVAEITEVSVTADTVRIEVTDTLDNSIYNFPITIRRALPTGWDSATVSQDSVVLPVSIVQSGGESFIQFSAIPDNGLVTISKENVAEVSNENDLTPIPFELYPNYPNPFNPSTVISYQLSVNSEVSLKVFDASGREVAVLVDGWVPAGTHRVQFNAADLASGLYMYTLQSGELVKTQKMILLK